MSAGERYGLSAPLAEPEPACPYKICDGSGWYTPKDDVGDDQLVFCNVRCGKWDAEGGCRGHVVELPCLCTADRRQP